MAFLDCLGNTAVGNRKEIVSRSSSMMMIQLSTSQSFNKIIILHDSSWCFVSFVPASPKKTALIGGTSGHCPTRSAESEAAGGRAATGWTPATPSYERLGVRSERWGAVGLGSHWGVSFLGSYICSSFKTNEAQKLPIFGVTRSKYFINAQVQWMTISCLKQTIGRLIWAFR